MKSIWIGYAHVIPNKDCDLLNDAVGAFVNVLVYCENTDEFKNQAKIFLKKYNFIVKDLKEIEMLENRKYRALISDEILSLAKTVNKNNQVALDEFQSYIKE